MLRELHISNFAIIEKQSIEFTAGFNVITGETGAGKSIILQALELLLGGKVKQGSVREGANELEVQGLFDLTKIANSLRETLPEYANSDELLLSRSVNTQGKSKVFINGRLGTLTLLEEISSKIMNICGQSQHVKLLDPQYHTAQIDAYAGNSELFATYLKAYDEMRETKQMLERFETESQSITNEIQLLEERINELSSVELFPKVRETLTAEINKLANGEKILSTLRIVTEAVDGEEGVTSQLKRIATEISNLQKYDDASKVVAERYDQIVEQLFTFSREISRYGKSIEIDEQALEKKREHLAEIARLERKYKKTADELILLFTESEERLKTLAVGKDKKTLAEAFEKAFDRAVKLAKKLSVERASASKKLINEIKAEFKEVKLGGAEFEVKTTATELTKRGAETIEFMLSANKGESLKPLRQIASGGELSRITLVLKKVLNDRTGINVLVFDEVDTGISGAVARAVGTKLKSLAEHSQVICITHLPQVASLADTHLFVDKVIGERTLSIIKYLNKNERIDEVARMLAGSKITEASRASARELIE